MPLTETHISAGKAVRRALYRAEQAHPNAPMLQALHERLTALLEAFRDDLNDDQFVALGGGTPKTPPDEE